jgi:hypothetical protein
MKLLYLVVQEGGSSVEAYPSIYGGPRGAARAAASHRRASYRSTEPIPFPVEREDRQANTITIKAADLVELIQSAMLADYE